MTTIHKILVIQTAFIGDVILITPLLSALKEIYPESIIDVLVSRKCEIVLKNNPVVNKIHKLNKRNFWQAIQNIKKGKYDLSVSPHSSIRSGVTAFLAGIKHRIGFKRYAQQLFLTNSIEHRKGVHKIEKNLDLMKLLPEQTSNQVFNKQTKLCPTSENYIKADGIMEGFTSMKKVLLAPGSVWFTKRWPTEHYNELASMLLEQGYMVILAGSPEEKALCDEIAGNQKNYYNLKNITGSFDILDTAALVEKVNLVVCNDSGMMHIANAMKTRVFAFFGPTVQGIGYYPYQQNDFIFEVDLPCRPCGSHGGVHCPLRHFNCMRAIKPETVFNKINEALCL